MNWYHREERRYVEYGSSFSASRRFGIARQLTDTVFNMNAEHLPADVPTVFESLDDAGVRTAGTTYLMYRGRHEHQISRETRADAAAVDASCAARSWARASSSTPTSSPAARPAAARSSACRACATSTPGCVGALPRRARPLRLPAALAARQRHALAQARARTRRSRRSPNADRQLERMMHAGGGADAFLDEHAVIVVADHSHAPVERRDRARRRVRRVRTSLPPSGAGHDEAEIALCPAQRCGDGLRAACPRRASAASRGSSRRARRSRASTS